MSEVKRYLAKISWAQIETQEHPNGEFVLWQDYARLKAEVEHLGDCLGDAHAHNIKEEVKIEMCIEGLKAEIERLRKAGDAMNNILIGRITSYEIGQAIDQWDAAKKNSQ